MPDNFSEVEFPYSTRMVGGTHVRLLTMVGARVVGASYSAWQEGDLVHEVFGCSLDWSIDGKFGTNGDNYPEMDLLPLPAKRAEAAAQIDKQIAAIRARLDANPDAPIEWRGGDEVRIGELSAMRDRMLGGDA